MKVLFIGSRSEVLERILDLNEELVCAYVTANSYASKLLSKKNHKHKIIDKFNKNDVFLEISKIDFDLLVSNGCPYIIPVEKIKKHHQVFINIHPSFLPYNKGMHPMNDVLLKNRKFTGVTCHHIDEGIDTGNIIYQYKIDITKEIDLDLLYQLCFKLEADVFEYSYNLLKKHKMIYLGFVQKKMNNVYKKENSDKIIRCDKNKSGQIYNIVRAFSIYDKGAICFYENKIITIIDVEVITNRFLKKKYMNEPAGKVLLLYSNKFLVKTIDGIIYVKKYQADFELLQGIILS